MPYDPFARGPYSVGVRAGRCSTDRLVDDAMQLLPHLGHIGRVAPLRQLLVGRPASRCWSASTRSPARGCSSSSSSASSRAGGPRSPNLGRASTEGSRAGGRHGPRRTRVSLIEGGRPRPPGPCPPYRRGLRRLAHVAFPAPFPANLLRRAEAEAETENHQQPCSLLTTPSESETTLTSCSTCRAWRASSSPWSGEHRGAGATRSIIRPLATMMWRTASLAHASWRPASGRRIVPLVQGRVRATHGMLTVVVPPRRWPSLVFLAEPEAAWLVVRRGLPGHGRRSRGGGGALAGHPWHARREPAGLRRGGVVTRLATGLI